MNSYLTNHNMNNTENISQLKAADFQKTVGGKETALFILKNKPGCEVAITNYGGAICSIMVPDKNGIFANVIQGHDSIDNLLNSPEPFLSTLVGRYGNRICKGKFTIDGKEYNLAINNGPNHLHGGPTGFHARVWDAEQLDAQTLKLHYLSADMEEGFPGNLDVTVVYTFTDENELKIEYTGTTDKKTNKALIPLDLIVLWWRQTVNIFLQYIFTNCDSCFKGTRAPRRR